jgi:hypothetical protein
VEGDKFQSTFIYLLSINIEGYTYEVVMVQ